MCWRSRRFYSFNLNFFFYLFNFSNDHWVFFNLNFFFLNWSIFWMNKFFFLFLSIRIKISLIESIKRWSFLLFRRLYLCLFCFYSFHFWCLFNFRESNFRFNWGHFLNIWDCFLIFDNFWRYRLCFNNFRKFRFEHLNNWLLNSIHISHLL